MVYSARIKLAHRLLGHICEQRGADTRQGQPVHLLARTGGPPASFLGETVKPTLRKTSRDGVDFSYGAFQFLGIFGVLPACVIYLKK